MFFKKFERYAFVILFIITVSCLIFGIYSFICNLTDSQKWIGTSGVLATITGLFQLEVSGLFEKIMEKFSDETKFPYGPPSHITRQIIDNPDAPLRTWFRNTFFFKVSTGFWLIVIGTIIQILAVWA